MHLSLKSVVNTDTKITNPTLKVKKILEDDALFSQVIFGPVKSYHCKCYTNNKHLIGQRCPKCGVLITSSNVRRYTISKIKLPFKIIHPFIFDRLAGKKKNKLKQLIYNLLNGQGYDIVDDKLVQSEKGLDSQFIFLKNFDKLIEFLYKANPRNLLLKMIYENIDNLLIDEILIIPPEMRPVYDDKIIDDINEHYAQIIEYCNRVEQSPLYSKELFESSDNLSDDFPIEIYKKYLGLLQYQVSKLYDYVISKLKGKSGLFRSNMLGKRVDFSGRAVIIVDPEIPLGYAGIPYLMLLELYKLQLANKLVEEKRSVSIQAAIEDIEKAIFNEDKIYWSDIEEIVSKDEWVQLNRQPSLHRMNLMGFKIKVVDGYCIGINPLICPAYNADFDGDSVIGDVNIKIKLCNKIKDGKNNIQKTWFEISSSIEDLKNMAIDLNKLRN